MKKSVKKEIEKLIEELELNCSIEEFKDKVDWDGISVNKKLSEDFIKEFKDYVWWWGIFRYQQWSGDFFEEFKDKCIEEL